MAEPVLMIRNSEQSLYKRCRLAWKWAYIEHLAPVSTKPVLAAGTLTHKVFERWYKKGRKRGGKKLHLLVPKIHRALVESGEYEDDIEHKPVPGSHEEYIPIEELVAGMLRNYQDEYGLDDHIEMIAPEQTFQVNVHRKGKLIGVAVGQIDGVYYDLEKNRYGFLEHKTGARLTPFGAPEELDEQSGMYWTYGPIWLKHTGQIPEDMEMDHLMFNRLRKHIGKDERDQNEDGLYLNLNGSISKRQPESMFARSFVFRTDRERKSLDRRFQSVVLEMDKVRRRKLPIYKSPGDHCGYCEFRDVCEVHEVGEDYRSILRSMFVKWDPYKDHKEKETVDAA